jgi:hypothetical protein
MGFDRHVRRGAVVVSAGFLLGALNVAGVAHAEPESSSAETGTRTARDVQRASAARAESARPATPARGREAGLRDRRDRNAERPPESAVVQHADPPTAPVPEPPPAAPQMLTPESASPAPSAALPGSHDAAEALSTPIALRPSESPTAGPSDSPTAAAVTAPAAATAAPPQAAAPQPPSLTSAVPAGTVDAADALTGGSATPLPSALAWTMLAAARSEVGRRSPGPAVAAVPAASTSEPVQPVGQYVSPLGTPQQTAAESMAMQTVHTLPVLAMKAVLGLAWRIIADIEYTQAGGPDQENLALLGGAVDEWAMASAFQSMILNSNDPAIVMQVAPPHHWYGLDVTGSRILYDNPDTIYRFAGVNYASQYVITGRMPENDPKASFSVLTGLTGSTAAVLDADQLELGPDRTFVITVSGAAAQSGQKNHLQITPDTTLIAIRDTLSDWNADDPMTLAIQRTAGPPRSLFGQFGGFALPFIGPLVAQSAFLTALVSLIPPLPAVPPFVSGSITALLMLRGISEESKYIKVATTDPVSGNRKGPNVFTDPTSNASFLATQVQSAGYFHLSDSEALVLTITPNNAGYFVVPVTNDWTITDNYWDDQTSLNNTQAKANPDGSYTVVVSPTEPQLAGGTSVWNWVSTGGLNQGTLAIRFQSIDQSDPIKPTVSSRVVALSELASVLPAGTVVVTPAERAVQIASRGAGFNRRFAPYLQTTPLSPG